MPIMVMKAKIYFTSMQDIKQKSSSQTSKHGYVWQTSSKTAEHRVSDKLQCEKHEQYLYVSRPEYFVLVNANSMQSLHMTAFTVPSESKRMSPCVSSCPRQVGVTDPWRQITPSTGQGRYCTLVKARIRIQRRLLHTSFLCATSEYSSAQVDLGTFFGHSTHSA